MIKSSSILFREAFKNNKPKGLKVAKEVLMSIGSMVGSSGGINLQIDMYNAKKQAR